MTAPIAITEPDLLARQRLGDEEFAEHFLELVAHFPARESTRASFEHGLRYPWSRPGRSYLLRDGGTVLLHALDPVRTRQVLAEHGGPEAGRVPLLAIGSNAAPKNLALKLAHHPEPADREVLVLTGEVRDLDVVASAAVTAYGAMPATLAASPGTSVRVALLFVNATQLATLTWGEMPYRLGRLRGAPVAIEDGVEGLEVDSPLAFVSRWGAFAPDGVPAPLAALEARDRRWRPWTQRELLDRAAEIVLGAEAGGGEALVRALRADVAGLAARALPAIAPYAQPFAFPAWAPIGADGTIPGS